MISPHGQSNLSSPSMWQGVGITTTRTVWVQQEQHAKQTRAPTAYCLNKAECSSVSQSKHQSRDQEQLLLLLHWVSCLFFTVI